MRKIGLISSLILFAWLMIACGNENNSNKNESIQNKEQRIISLNAAVTEILAELGTDGELVGRDATSVYPQWVKDSVKDFGPAWMIGTETLLAAKPDIIFADAAELAPEKIKNIENAGVKVVAFEKENSAEGVKKIIQEVAAYTKNQDYQYLIDRVDEGLAKVEHFGKKPKVLFIYARGTALMQVAGKNTPMEEVIELAGGENAVREFEGMKALSPEALVGNNPDVILIFESSLRSLGGIEGLANIQGIKETNAFKNKAFIVMDGSLLNGFGPRFGEAVYDLNQNLKPYAK